MLGVAHLNVHIVVCLYMSHFQLAMQQKNPDLGARGRALGKAMGEYDPGKMDNLRIAAFSVEFQEVT